MMHNLQASKFFYTLNILFGLIVGGSLNGLSQNGTLGNYSTSGLLENAESILPTSATSEVSFSNLTRGSGIKAVSAKNKYISDSWTKSKSLDIDDYYEFTITPSNCSSFSVTEIRFNLVSSKSSGNHSGGPKILALKSSFAKNIQTFEINDDDKAKLITISDLNILNISEPVTFRLYGYNAEDPSGTLAISDTKTVGVAIDGTFSVRPKPIAGISGSTTVCQNATAPNLTFTNTMALPVTVTYNINGANQTIINLGSNATVTVAASTTIPGSFAYNLVSVVYQTSPACSNAISGAATINVMQQVHTNKITKL